MLLRNMKFNLKFSPEDQGGGGGSALGTTPPPAASDAPAETTPPAPAASKVTLPDNWKDSLPDDLKNDPNMKVIHDVPALAKSFIAAQKAIGADKIAKPGKHATDEDWNNFYKQIGLPDTLDKYDVGLNTQEMGYEEEFVKELKDVALKANIMPGQLKKVLEWYKTVGDKTEQKMAEAQKHQVDEGIKGLQTEWGEAYNQNIMAAKNVVLEFADPGLQERFLKTNLGSDPAMLKMLHKFSLQLKEGQIHGTGGVGSGRLAPKEAQEKLTAMAADPKHPYNDKLHPNHAIAVKEATELAKQAYPSGR